MPESSKREASRASSASLLRGRARNEMPKAFTKQAAASPPARASAAAVKRQSTRTPLAGRPKPESRA